APPLAFVLGYVGTRAWDGRAPAGVEAPSISGALAALLVIFAALASFAMGANDVANAAGPLVFSGAFPPFLAIALASVGLAVGVLTWRRPLLERVAFRIVRLDGRLAVISQLAQSAVILGSVSFGYFTSMNQALVGAMLGAGTARGSVVDWRGSVRSILI